MAENLQDGLKNEAGKVKAPALTLEPEQDIFSGEAPSRMEVAEMGESSGYSAGAVDETMLSPEERTQVREFAQSVDLTNEKQIISFGASAQKGIAGFSTTITSKIKTQEFGEVGDDLRELRAAINSTTEPKKKGFLGLFQKGKAKFTYFISNYESAETNIKKIEKDLKKHQQVISKDIMVYEEMYNLNLRYYKEITMYIIAGKKALENARNTTLIELRERAEETRDQMDVQRAKDFEEACTRFGKKLYDLELSRMISIQMAPQIRLLQNADREIVDRLQSDIINTIPLWRNQMVLALGITHTRKALDAQSAVTEMTNEMLRRNSETLKQGAIDAAVASERGIVDVDTLRKCNEDIIFSINEVVKIHEEGTKKRAEAEEELVKIEENFKTALLEAAHK